MKNIDCDVGCMRNIVCVHSSNRRNFYLVKDA